MTSKFKIKRDIISANAPHPDQLEIGELAINAVTGKLYTKLVNGKIIEFTGQPICYDKTPSISFSDVTQFCCFGDLLTVTVKDLKNTPAVYDFELQDLSNNSVTYSISSPIYNSYLVYPDTTSIDISQTPITLREAIVPISISIGGTKDISVLKFKTIFNNDVVAERIISIACRNC